MRIIFRDPENKYIKEYPKEFHFYKLHQNYCM